MSQTWFITGSSRGFGRALVLAALRAGDRVVATARRPEQLDEVVSEFGDSILPLALDVTDPSRVVDALHEAHQRFGRIDVVVNNAGYANVAPIETASEEDFRRQFETNFWGVYHVSRAAIPLLREQGSGLIVQFSSVGGRVGGSPGIASYQAAKFAIDGFSRSLRAEIAPFGTKVLVVEPSGFRTDWAGSSMEVQDVPEEYAATVGQVSGVLRALASEAPGDPARVAEILVALAKQSEIPENLPVGVNATEMSVALDQKLLASDLRWAPVSHSADIGEPFPVEFPPPAP
ncbi:SDR family NAD(P)-dependent oxidoreductase [Microbacterium sp. I2]|jgi:NAD(P)-dependent dehydrogenase (short-subunit alcohol dehydrogenase family)|uniref:SDR family NAD(P)-dependent oxidoreductase n=1 Tax=Microbacterium terregens TaxID=69363 RepID=A0ABV5T433_9MICO